MFLSFSGIWASVSLSNLENEKFWQMLVSNFLCFQYFSYNNKTYRIDDIDWNKHPTDSFNKADGSTVTFKDYYEESYKKPVQDDQQPLLISIPKDKDKKRGMSGPILLLPEFCSITGTLDLTFD